MDDECIHGLGPIAACTICNGREVRERAARDAVVRTWAAKFPGTCRKCGDEFAVDDLIGITADERYVHAECP